MKRGLKNHAPVQKYSSVNQLSFEGFESPFERQLNPKNRWVVLSKLLPWDDLCAMYLKTVSFNRDK